VSKCRNVAFVRHQNDGISLRWSLSNNFRISSPVGRIQIAGRFIRKDDRGRFTSARAIATRLPLTAGQFIRFMVHAVIKLDIMRASSARDVRSLAGTPL